MSETHRTLFNFRRRLHKALCGRRLCTCYLSIAGAFVLLAIFFAFRTPPPPREPMTETSETQPVHPRRVRLTSPPVFETEAFYRTIIDNNLFRPLGWTPSRPREPYRLIGTVLPRSEKAKAKAILESTAGETSSTFEVSAGDRLDSETVVISIAGKSVVLETSGKRRTLHLPSGF